MKTKLTVLFMSCTLILQGISSLSAQVTIGTNDPPQKYSVLEVVSTATNPGGLRLPHVSNTDKTALEADLLADPGNSKGLLIYSTNNGRVESWDGTKWVATQQPWLVSGSTTEATTNTQNIYQMGSVAIGHNGAVDPTAILNVQSANKGVLLPRVALKSSTDDVTIPTPTTGLLVYNTGAESTFTTVGYMFWDGSAWKLFANSSSESGSARLNCAGATMSPAQQIVGGTDIIAGTILQIPYTGSNGGSFNGATLTSTGNTNVTATISGGMLSAGNGVLNFALSGTPTVSQQAPNGITFDLTDFLDANTGITGCDEVVVGNVLTASVETTAVMGFLMETTDDNGAVGYGLQCNSPDGKFSVRVWIPKLTIYNTITAQNGAVPNVQLKNNSESTVKVIWNDITFYSNGTAVPISANGVMNVPSKVWGGNNNVGGATPTQWVNSSATSNAGYFGQVGIYDGSGNGPEYRRYTWIPIGNNEKTSYEIHVMAAIDNPAGTLLSNYSGTPTQVKVYIKFEQVTAQ